MTLLRDACSIVEQMSIDEAYLDLTNQLALWAEAPEVARQLQHKVHEEVGLSASLGVATNKLVAKVASDQDKPRGLTVVPPGAEASFLGPLPVRVLWGIGPVTAQKLAEMGVSTVGELALVDKQELLTRFGTQGATMALQAQGIDDRPVITDHELKSASQEQTFGRDLADQEILEEHLRRLSEGVAERLKRADLAAATVVVKLRYADFTTLTRQMTLAVPTNDHEEIHQAALILFQRTWKKGRPLRLLGVAGRQLSPPVGQLSFW
jgi:DNA polymerase-4